MVIFIKLVIIHFFLKKKLEDLFGGNDNNNDNSNVTKTISGNKFIIINL